MMTETTTTTSGITVAGLRELLYGLTDQDQAVHIVTKEKYGEVISTKGVTGIRLLLRRLFVII